LRQAVIANNIANMSTPGFRRSTLPFEKAFAAALAAGKPIAHRAVLEHIVQPRTGALNEFGNDVQIDTEVGELIKNSMLYKTYVRLLNRMYRQMELAMAAGADGTIVKPFDRHALRDQLRGLELI